MTAMTELQFSLNGSPRRVADQRVVRVDVLRDLRRIDVDRGTKRADGGPDWRAVCACILPLGQLDGCRVVTAEGLGDGTGGPHPAQRAMADQFATQCGYCSPGFVMSLAAIATTRERDEDSLMDALAGNLCRCTGYTKIIDAVVDASRELFASGADAKSKTRKVTSSLRRMPSDRAVRTRVRSVSASVFSHVPRPSRGMPSSVDASLDSPR